MMTQTSATIENEYEALCHHGFTMVNKYRQTPYITPGVPNISIASMLHEL